MSPSAAHPDWSTDPANGFEAAMRRREVWPNLRWDRLAQVLAPGEQVLLALPALADDVGPRAMLVTPARVLIAHLAGLRMLAKAAREAPADRVRAVSFGGGLISPVRVEIQGARNITMQANRREDAASFTREFDHLIHTGRLPG